MSAAPAKKAAAAKKASTGPSYVDMIKATIAAHPEEARTGVSRPTIKKYLHSKYPQTSKITDAAFNNHISKAIAKGKETGVFTLPKGISGKVKLAKVDKPKKAAVKKPAVKKPKTATTAVKKTPATKAKKPAAAKKTKSTTATKAKKPAAKKTATKPAAKKAAAKPKKAAVKKA